MGEFLIQCTLCDSSFESEKLYDMHPCLNADVKVPFKIEAVQDEEEAELEKEVKNAIKQASVTLKEESPVFYVKAEPDDAESEAEDPLGLDIDDPEPACPEQMSDGNSRGFKIIKCDFECSICKKLFRREEDFIDHKLNVHKDSKPYQCQVCNKKFSRPHYMAMHMLIHSGERPYKCNVCFSTFTYKAGYDIHMRTHKFEQTLRCVICRKVCLDRPELDNHMKSHMKESVYECEICGAEFNHARTLTTHRLKAHAENKAYECPYCGKKFRNWHKHKIHIRLHTGERPYRCKVCGKGFPRNDEVKRHMRSHQGIKAFKCSICSVYCATQASITGHIDLHHAELKPDNSSAPEKTVVMDSQSGILGTRAPQPRTLYKPIISAASSDPYHSSTEKIDPSTSDSGDNEGISNKNTKCLSYKEYLERQEQMLARRGLIVRDPKSSSACQGSSIFSPKKDATMVTEKQSAEVNARKQVINILSQTSKSGGTINLGLSGSLSSQIQSKATTTIASATSGAQLKFTQPSALWPQTAAGRGQQIIFLKSAGNQQNKKNVSQPVVLLCGYDAESGEQVMITQPPNVGADELQKIMIPGSVLGLPHEGSAKTAKEMVKIKEEVIESVPVKDENVLQTVIKQEPGVEISMEVVIKQEPEDANVVFASTFGNIEIKKEPQDDY